MAGKGKKAYQHQPNFCFGTRMVNQPESGSAFNPGWAAPSTEVYRFGAVAAPLAAIVRKVGKS